MSCFQQVRCSGRCFGTPQGPPRPWFSLVTHTHSACYSAYITAQRRDITDEANSWRGRAGYAASSLRPRAAPQALLHCLTDSLLP